MPFYTGSSADGSDMHEAQGMYVSPCGKYWSNMPFRNGAKNIQWKNRIKSLTNKQLIK